MGSDANKRFLEEQIIGFLKEFVMQIKKSGLDTTVYIVFCVLTLGTVWLMRIIISEAIRKSIDS